MREYTVEEFVSTLQFEIKENKLNFIKNMKDGSAPKRMDFMGWLDWFLNWMEWGDEESYRNAYGDLEDEEEKLLGNDTRRW